MPKGVEHPKHSPLALLELRVEIPLMPKGVEHVEQQVIAKARGLWRFL